MARRIGAIQAAQEVLDKGYYGVPARRRIDAFSASCVVQVAQALGDENREKLDQLQVREAAALCWKLVGRPGAASQ